MRPNRLANSPGARRRGTPAPRPGAAMVEMALVLPIVLFFLYGILEYARYMAARQVIENAAREGARYAVVRSIDETTQDAQVQGRVHDTLAGFGSTLAGYNKSTSIQVYKSDAAGTNIGSWKDAAFGEYITVRITGSYVPMIGSLWLPTGGGSANILQQHNLDIRSIMYSEAN